MAPFLICCFLALNVSVSINVVRWVFKSGRYTCPPSYIYTTELLYIFTYVYIIFMRRSVVCFTSERVWGLSPLQKFSKISSLLNLLHNMIKHPTLRNFTSKRVQGLSPLQKFSKTSILGIYYIYDRSIIHIYTCLHYMYAQIYGVIYIYI